jgi:hypothetical protein
MFSWQSGNIFGRLAWWLCSFGTMARWTSLCNASKVTRMTQVYRNVQSIQGRVTVMGTSRPYRAVLTRTRVLHGLRVMETERWHPSWSSYQIFRCVIINLIPKLLLVIDSRFVRWRLLSATRGGSILDDRFQCSAWKVDVRLADPGAVVPADVTEFEFLKCHGSPSKAIAKRG